MFPVPAVRRLSLTGTDLKYVEESDVDGATAAPSDLNVGRILSEFSVRPRGSDILLRLLPDRCHSGHGGADGRLVLAHLLGSTRGLSNVSARRR